MRNFILLLFSISITSSSFSQSSLGGVGTSSNLSIWMDASQLTFANNDLVDSWTDLSANNNNLSQPNASFQPTFKTSQINGLPTVEFDGTNDRFDFSSNILDSAITIFLVANTTKTNYSSILSLNRHHIASSSNQLRADNPLQNTSISKPINSFSISAISTEANTTSGAYNLWNDNNSSSKARGAIADRISPTLGSLFLSGAYKFFFQGQMAEIIVFNEQLNSAKRKIVSNHLAGKYNLTAEQNLYEHKTTHGNQVIGVGQEADGSHTLARGNDSLEISNASALGNGDYILVGNDDGGYSSSNSVGVGAVQRWTQVWRADLTGSPGTIDLTFFLGANDFATDPNDYVVLIERVDGDFSNGGTVIEESGRVYDAVNETVSFTGITLIDGDYFTVAEKSGVAPPSDEPIDYGPGGVGSTDNISLWLDANSLNLTNNSAISVWEDLSGNSNDPSQSNSSFQPTFKTTQINGLPSIEFDGTNDRLDFSENMLDSALTIFLVSNTTKSNYSSILALNRHHIASSSNKLRADNPLQTTSISKPINSFSVSAISTEANTTSGNYNLWNSSNSTSNARGAIDDRIVPSIGSLFLSGAFKFFFQGQMAEIIVFNEQINSAKRKIVSNHLAGKYNLTAEENLYTHKSTHGHEVIGLGQEADGSHLESRGRDSILINNASTLGNGDYILIGNDNADFSIIATTAGGVVERWNRTWKVDKTGTPGAIDIQFFLGGNSFASPSDYVVIIEEDDGDFSNGGTRVVTGGSFDAGTLSMTFTGIDFADGAIFTLAEKGSAIESVADADWSLTTTWDCGCVPANSDTVSVIHDVTISSNQEVLDLTITNGSITFSGNDTLAIYEALAIGTGGSISAGNGTLAASGTSAQTFDNTSGSVAALNNLFVNSTNGASIESGEWSINNHLQVSSGGLDVTNATSVTLISNASTTAQVLESMSGAFTGEFIVQRNITGRNSNYSNMSSPISDATAADLDDDLVLSGIGGNDGNALNTSGGTFHSMLFFDSPTDAHVNITSTSTALPSGIGFEVFLDTVPYFSGAVVDYVGSLFSGSTTVSTDAGWNLIGNPYQSFIDWTQVSKGSIPDEYYIYNSSTGNYDFFSGGSIPDIAPGQGFWAELSSGSQNVTFEENDKVDNNSSAFLRSKASSRFNLALSSAETNYSHQMEVIFDVNATAELDDLDASYLKSPVKDAPAIYSKVINSDKGLIVTSLNPFVESQLIPVEIYAGLDGTYSIATENISELYKDYSCIYLKDKASNDAIDLSVEQSYQFETTKGTSNRFELIVSNSFVDCEQLIEDGSFEQKLDHQLSLRNAYGDWYVDYTLDDQQQQIEIRIINMAGQEVKKPVSFGASNAGTYRLQNLQDLNGIYVIQVKTKDGFLNKTVQL